MTVTDNQEIGKYIIEQTVIPEDFEKNQFSSVISKLSWNLENFPDNKLDTKISSSTQIIVKIASKTWFHIFYGRKVLEFKKPIRNTTDKETFDSEQAEMRNSAESFEKNYHYTRIPNEGMRNNAQYFIEGEKRNNEQYYTKDKNSDPRQEK